MISLKKNSVVIVGNPESLSLDELAWLLTRSQKANAKLVFVSKPDSRAGGQDPAAADFIRRILVRETLGKRREREREYER